MFKLKNVEFDKEKIITDAITIFLGITMSAIVLGALYIVLVPKLTFGGTVNSNESTEIDTALEEIKEAMNKVKSDYYEDVTIEAMKEGAIAGVANSTDDAYTRYMSQEEYDELLTSGNEKYTGIGVHVSYDSESGGIIILGTMPDSPALEAGLKGGDVILKVEDEIVTSENYLDCVDKMKDETGKNSELTLTLKRGNKVFEKKVIRREITANNIESKIVGNNIGYIKIWAFENDVYKQFRAEYIKLMAKEVKGLIIDVRNNPGGLVSDTVQIADLLLPKCDIVKLVYKDKINQSYTSSDAEKIEVPLVILVNERSASASEILSGAIKDSKVGVVIGNKTFGKGVVQTVEKLTGEGALSITTARYYTASGIDIHGNGIEPNIQVNLPDEVKNDSVIAEDKDTQLKEAIKYVNQNTK